MTNTTRIGWVAAAALSFLVGLAGLYRWVVSPSGPLDTITARVGGDFELTTHESKRLSSRDLIGKPFLVFFGFTHCPDVCPTSMLELSNNLRKLGPDADKMRYLFISVDHEQDTPELLKMYLSSFDSRIIGLTGTAEEIARLSHHR